MKPEDIRDYFTLRRMTANPWEIVRFRKAHGDKNLVIRMLDEPPPQGPQPRE